MKKFFIIISFIFVFLCGNLKQISASPLDELFLDDITKQYISEKITDNLTFINSKYNFDFVQVNKNGVGNPINEIKTDVYSFKYIENNENKGYSFITVEFPENIKFYEQDTIKIITNLAYISPVECLVLGKDKENQLWQEVDKFELRTSFNSMESYSGQLKNKYKYTKLIISFPYVKFKNLKDFTPEYKITYTNYTIYNYIKFLYIIIIILVFISAYLLFKLKK